MYPQRKYLIICIAVSLMNWPSLLNADNVALRNYMHKIRATNEQYLVVRELLHVYYNADTIDEDRSPANSVNNYDYEDEHEDDIYFEDILTEYGNKDENEKDIFHFITKLLLETVSPFLTIDSTEAEEYRKHVDAVVQGKKRALTNSALSQTTLELLFSFTKGLAAFNSPAALNMDGFGIFFSDLGSENIEAEYNIFVLQGAYNVGNLVRGKNAKDIDIQVIKSLLMLMSSNEQDRYNMIYKAVKKLNEILY